MPDPRLSKVLNASNQLVADAGGKLIEEGHILTILAACGNDDRCAHALVSMIAESTRLAQRIDADKEQTARNRAAIIWLTERKQQCTTCLGLCVVSGPDGTSRACNLCAGEGVIV